MLRAHNIQYEMAERTRAIHCGAIGAFHVLVRKAGLIEAIDESLHLLKRHLPYHESDHVLNIAYNTLTGGMCLDDIELHRGDEAYMDALGAQRIPDPTTAGDFSRRFEQSDVVELMDAVGCVRVKMWRRRLSRAERAEAADARTVVLLRQWQIKKNSPIRCRDTQGNGPRPRTVTKPWQPSRPQSRPDALPWSATVRCPA